VIAALACWGKTGCNYLRSVRVKYRVFLRVVLLFYLLREGWCLPVCLYASHMVNNNTSSLYPRHCAKMSQRQQVLCGSCNGTNVTAPKRRLLEKARPFVGPRSVFVRPWPWPSLTRMIMTTMRRRRKERPPPPPFGRSRRGHLQTTSKYNVLRADGERNLCDNFIAKQLLDHGLDPLVWNNPIENQESTTAPAPMGIAALSMCSYRQNWTRPRK
jgi:hypothetical protein